MPALISSNIIDAIHNIEEDTEGLIFHDFDGDRRRKDAVIRNFEVIGEVTKNFSNNLKISNPQLMYREIAQAGKVMNKVSVICGSNTDNCG